MILEGNVSVKAAVLARRRSVTRIYADIKKHDRDTAFILRKAKENHIEILRVPREEIDAMASGRTHGGLIAVAEGRTYQNAVEVSEKENPFFVFAEGIEDPFNLGYVIRSLYAAGCDGLFLEKRNWANAEPVILRSSAGAFEYLDIVMSDCLAEDLRAIREKGIRCLAAMRKDAESCFKADLKRPLCLALGGEMRGLSSAVLHQADQNIFIPYANGFRNALNASSACSVLAFEIMRQNSAGQ